MAAGLPHCPPMLPLDFWLSCLAFWDRVVFERSCSSLQGMDGKKAKGLSIPKEEWEILNMEITLAEAVETSGTFQRSPYCSGPDPKELSEPDMLLMTKEKSFISPADQRSCDSYITLRHTVLGQEWGHYFQYMLLCTDGKRTMGQPLCWWHHLRGTRL